MPDRIELSPELRSKLLDPDLLPKEITVNGKKYNPEAPVNAGFKGAVWKVKDEFGRIRALKLSIYDDYNDRSYLQELSRASVLEPYPVFAHFVDAGLCEHTIDANKYSFVGFVEEWIDGVTFDEFIVEYKEEISSSFILSYVQSMSNALNIMKVANLKHDDLHANNVMLVRPPKGSLIAEWSIKIIDTGSMKPFDSTRKKPKDDHIHFVDHLVLIWNAFHSRKMLLVRDKRFLSAVQRLIQTMLDDDITIALREPSQIVRQFEMAYTRANSLRAESQTALSSPFEFISAEHIADDRVLVDIFARSCPWLSKVEGVDPCLITGPRGCGKSTIFRWLSLKAHLHKDFCEIDSLRIAGFYVSCSSELQNRLGWMKTDALAERFRKDIIHYFNLLITREILHTLLFISQREDSTTAFGLGSQQENEICSFIENSLAQTERMYLHGVSRFTRILEAVESVMFATHCEMLRNNNIRNPLPETYLGDLTTLLSEKVMFFNVKKIAVLLDDFSTHRLPSPVQVILNQVIWERRPSHVFKLSSEKHGAILIDSLNATVDVTREMIEIDCGREYVALDDTKQVNQAIKFSTELLDNRLKSAGYLGRCENIIGHSEWDGGSLARALVEKRNGRSADQYHGIECIANICSGDVSTLLFLYRRIFEKGRVDASTSKIVSKRDQNDAIRSASRELFENIRYYYPHGTEMYNIVNAFGNLVRNILENAKWQKKGTSQVPTQCPRIELDQTSGSPIDTINDSQLELAKELIRRAIFIEMEPGLSRHSNVTTLRWQIRRIFLPCFGAALSKNDAVKEKIDWLKYFLTDPPGSCKQVYDKWPKKNSYASDRQGKLFGE